MDRYEAELAVISAALCEHRGIVYYAYSVVYTKNPRAICKNRSLSDFH